MRDLSSDLVDGVPKISISVKFIPKFLSICPHCTYKFILSYHL